MPDVVSALEANLERNTVADRVEVHLEGLGEPGTSMRVPSAQGGSALPSFYSSRMHFDDGLLVAFRSLDSVAELLPAEARVVMKIDVEGTENQIFRYGQEFLRRFRPDILCEVLFDVADGRELEALLAPHDLHTSLVRESDLLPLLHHPCSVKLQGSVLPKVQALSISVTGGGKARCHRPSRARLIPPPPPAPRRGGSRPDTRSFSRCTGRNRGALPDSSTLSPAGPSRALLTPRLLVRSAPSVLVIA